MTTTTIGSSLPYVAEIKSLSPATQAYLYADYDELQAYRAKPALQTQAMRQVKINAADIKDTQLQAATRMVLTVKRKALAIMGWKDRSSFIRDQLERAPVAWGLTADYAEQARERDIRLIRTTLHAWEKINGLYHKSEPLD